jgi:hypothetical protein
MQQNLGGASLDVGAMRYTNAVFAEDEENMPPGWFRTAPSATASRLAPTLARVRDWGH